jgi:formiminotetrahydrofolate cyclodeaminase
MYIDQPLRYFMDRLASSFPEPGGGSVAALSGALGAALVSMVSNLTVGKQKYRDVQPQARTLLEESERLRAVMQELMQRDTEAYGALSEVYKMPKETENEKSARSEAIQGALKKACEVPFNIGIRSFDIAKLARQAVEIGNAAAVSDAGMAVVLAYACAECAALNVRINLKGIKDEEYNRGARSQIEQVLKQMKDLKDQVIEATYLKMG